MKRVLYLLPLLLAFAMSSCSSLSKQANEMFEAGAYDDAVRTYDQVLAKDPGDADAIRGRARAREKLVDTKLIEIRKSRLAGNEQNALDMLRTIVLQENTWGFFPKGAVAYTQEEESREALRYVEGQVRAALPSQHPLRAEYLLVHYAPIFGGELQARSNALLSLARGERKANCKRLVSASAAPGPYYTTFLQKFCGDNAAVSKSASKNTARKYAELYRAVKATVAVEGLPREYGAAITESLREGLAKTPWFDVHGTKEWNVHVGGNYSVEQREKPEVRWHSYTVSVPYVSFEDQRKTHEVPYTTTEYRCTPNSDGSQNCTHVPITRFRSEAYTETVPVTRYRDEPRSQPYTGQLRSQSLALHLAAPVRFGDIARELAVNEKQDNSGFEHDNRMPDIGLYPQQANLPDAGAWLRTGLTQLAAATQAQGNAAWEERYCKPLSQNRSVAETGEQVHRCLRRNPPVLPKFVETWYEHNLGISVSQADEVIGVRDF
jgi:hypothetical protein